MKIVIFGLTISSSWGNGHATVWRGLCRALSQAGHAIVFFERDTPYYAETRDLFELPYAGLVIYGNWDDAIAAARRELKDADAAIVTSYCPDAEEASELVLASACPVRAFYDLDAPVTIERLRAGVNVAYIPSRGLGEFDLVLSFAGGRTLEELRSRLGARRTAALYGHVDPDVHRPVEPADRYRCDLSYLGTYAEDRQDDLSSLFIQPAHCRQGMRFTIGGAQYPPAFPWRDNIFFVRHLPPDEHPAFFSSSRLTLNVTRRAMAEMGWCPSGRLFEAAACGAAILSDHWDGLSTFFTPGEEILLAGSTSDVLLALDMDETEIRRIARRARERVLTEHTSERRAHQLVDLLESAAARSPVDMLDA